jgi:hypothetical protein
MTSGNDFTIGTFRYAGKPIYRLPIICPTSPWPQDKDHGACRKCFLWFGSQGFLHKGLDLVLEVFAGLPDHHLTVPIVSYEAAVDVDDFGVIVEADGVEDVRDAVLRVSTMSAAELEQRSREAWASARSYHTVQNFVAEYRKATEAILAWAGSGRRGPAPGLLPAEAA